MVALTTRAWRKVSRFTMAVDPLASTPGSGEPPAPLQTTRPRAQRRGSIYGPWCDGHAPVHYFCPTSTAPAQVWRPLSGSPDTPGQLNPITGIQHSRTTLHPGSQEGELHSASRAANGKERAFVPSSRLPEQACSELVRPALAARLHRLCALLRAPPWASTPYRVLHRTQGRTSARYRCRMYVARRRNDTASPAVFFWRPVRISGRRNDRLSRHSLANDGRPV